MGYLNKSKATGAMNLVTPCFTAVNGSNKIKLSDIKITGYKDGNGYKEGWGIDNGIAKAAVIARINGNGGTLRQNVGGTDYNVEYYWTDTKSKPAGWYDFNGKPMTADGGSLWGDAADIEFTNGNGFRLKLNAFYMEDDEEEEGPTLPLEIVFNGEVLQGDPEIAYDPGVMKAAGNLLPVEVALSEISVTGYTDKDGKYLQGWGIDNGIAKAAVIAKINGNGGTLRQNVNGTDYNVEYYWTDTKTKAAGWYDFNGKPMTKDGDSLWGDAANIKFGAADGYRVKINAFYQEDDEEEEGPTLPMSIKLPGCL